ncbi:MAG: peptidoglycan-binding domain-containing protein [Paracoccaceae bacterium]
MTRNQPIILAAALTCAAALSGCQTTVPGGEPALVSHIEEAPPGAPADTCWGKDVSPAVIETVTDQIMLQPAEVLEDGTVISPAVFKTETRQAIVQERRETWFQTPCAAQQTPDFVASLQRALAARGLFRGTVTGIMDNRTRRAVRAFQKPQGLDSGILSLAAARKLGLVAVARPTE